MNQDKPVKANVITAGHLEAAPDQPGMILPYAMLIQFPDEKSFRAANKAGRLEFEHQARPAILEPGGYE